MRQNSEEHGSKRKQIMILTVCLAVVAVILSVIVFNSTKSAEAQKNSSGTSVTSDFSETVQGESTGKDQAAKEKKQAATSETAADDPEEARIPALPPEGDKEDAVPAGSPANPAAASRSTSAPADMQDNDTNAETTAPASDPNSETAASDPNSETAAPASNSGNGTTTQASNSESETPTPSMPSTPSAEVGTTAPPIVMTPEVHVHELTQVKAAQANCTEDGNIAYFICSRCGKWFEDANGLAEITDKSTVIINASGHRWDKGVITKAATITRDGERTYTCLNDSSHVKTEKIPHKQKGDPYDRPEDDIAPDDVSEWLMDAAGWHYRENGVLVKNAWRRLPYNGQHNWYLFDENGIMKTGWAEWNGEMYYLNPVADGLMGSMLTGLQEIEGNWYYFETAEGDTLGRMYHNEKIPDGRFAGEDGVITEGE